MPLGPEDIAHEQIDRMLVQAGWAVQDAKAVNLYAKQGVAIREVEFKFGFGATYYLFCKSMDPKTFQSELRGGVWSTPTPVSTLGAVAANPFVKMDKSGSAILLWNQVDANDKQVFRMHYLNGGWTDAYLMAVSHNGLNNVVYDVAMDGSGDALIAWDQSDGSTWSIYRSFYQ
jgi:hypothetical protein